MNDTETTDSPAAERKRRFPRLPGGRKTTALLAVALVAALTAAFGLPLYERLATHESTDDAFVEARIVSISPRVAGHLDQILVEDNQRVEKGQLLAVVDPRDYQVALDIARARRESAAAEKAEAEAQVSAARNTLAQRRASLSSSRAELAQVRAGVAEYEAGNDRDKNDLERMRAIAKAGAVSRQEYDHAKAQAAVSRAKLHSAKKEVETHSALIGQARATVDTAEDELRRALSVVDVRDADLREAEAEVRRAELNLSYARITAPSAGYVTKKAVEPGAYVQVGQTLLSIVEPEVWVVANFKETQIEHMRPGQPVEIEVDAYPGAPLEGRIASIQHGTGSRFTLLPPEDATGNYIKVVQRVPVKIALCRPNGSAGALLAPGMSVVPSVDVSEGADSVRLSACSEIPPRTTLQ